MSEMRLFWLQRMSAMLLAPFVVVHLMVILYATSRGVSAADILSRTQGSVLWASFYGLFVAAAAVHAPIGLRNVVREWTTWTGPGMDRAMIAFGLALLVLGLRAVWAVVS